MASKWISEEVWLSALKYASSVIRDYRKRADCPYPESRRVKLRYKAVQKFNRIKSAGEREWQERYDA